MYVFLLVQIKNGELVAWYQILFFGQPSIQPQHKKLRYNDEQQYFIVRRQLLTLNTKCEHARANRIANQLDPSQIHVTTDALVKKKLTKRQQKHDSIIVHYNYEGRFAYYKSKIHQLWNATFPISSGIDTKLIVGTRNNPNLTHELVRRSPSLHVRRLADKSTTA